MRDEQQAELERQMSSKASVSMKRRDQQSYISPPRDTIKEGFGTTTAQMRESMNDLNGLRSSYQLNVERNFLNDSIEGSLNDMRREANKAKKENEQAMQKLTDL